MKEEGGRRDARRKTGEGRGIRRRDACAPRGERLEAAPPEGEG